MAPRGSPKATVVAAETTQAALPMEERPARTGGPGGSALDPCFGVHATACSLAVTPLGYGDAGFVTATAPSAASRGSTGSGRRRPVGGGLPDRPVHRVVRRRQDACRSPTEGVVRLNGKGNGRRTGIGRAGVECDHWPLSPDRSGQQVVACTGWHPPLGGVGRDDTGARDCEGRRCGYHPSQTDGPDGSQNEGIPMVQSNSFLEGPFAPGTEEVAALMCTCAQR
jgi:hypothetical protein